ncbi:MAG: hypothetical protein RLZZ453_208 [Chlamydiota bacterium]|jgi:shikimate kinase
MKPLVLFGFKGCGKTFFGKKLSEGLKISYLDTDHGLPSYKEVGERRFRESEREAVLSIDPHFQGVISLGGGAILDASCQEYLVELGTLVYLKASFSRIASHLTQLPAFVSSLEELEEIYYKREPLYSAIPARICNLDTMNNTAVLEMLTEIYGS